MLAQGAQRLNVCAWGRYDKDVAELRGRPEAMMRGLGGDYGSSMGCLTIKLTLESLILSHQFQNETTQQSSGCRRNHGSLRGESMGLLHRGDLRTSRAAAGGNTRHMFTNFYTF